MASTGLPMCLVILFTLVGNGLVVIAVASTRRLRSSVTNYFVVSLAVADLTVAVLVMPYADQSVITDDVSILRDIATTLTLNVTT